MRNIKTNMEVLLSQRLKPMLQGVVNQFCQLSISLKAVLGVFSFVLLLLFTSIGPRIVFACHGQGLKVSGVSGGLLSNTIYVENFSYNDNGLNISGEGAYLKGISYLGKTIEYIKVKRIKLDIADEASKESFAQLLDWSAYRMEVSEVATKLKINKDARQFKNVSCDQCDGKYVVHIKSAGGQYNFPLTSLFLK